MKKQLNNEIKTIINIFLIVLILLVGYKNSTLAEVIINNQSKQLPKANEFNMNAVTFDLTERKVKLNSGYYMPTNGLGTWSLYGDTAYNSVYNALKVGVRLIDTAQY